MMIANQKQKKRIAIFSRVDKILAKGIKNVFSDVPRQWLKERGLSSEVTGAGFCSGQLNKRTTEEFVCDLEFIGFIRPNNIIGKGGKTGYLIFADYGITFPLRDVKGNVVNFFGIPIRWKQKHIAFLNDDGIYPAYPHEMTTRLIIVISIIDAATILQAKVLSNRDSVMCIPNGKILPQHEEAIKRLTQLKSILWIVSQKIKSEVGLEGRVMPEGYITKSKKKL